MTLALCCRQRSDFKRLQTTQPASTDSDECQKGSKRSGCPMFVSASLAKPMPITSQPPAWMIPRSFIPEKNEGSGYIPPPRDFTDADEPGFFDRLLDTSEHVAKFGVGVGLGVMIGITPGAALVTAPLSTGDRDIEIGRGVGEMGVGLMEMVEGAPGAVGGVLGAPETGGLSLVAAVPEALGMMNVAGGLVALNRGLSMSTGGKASSPSPKSTSGQSRSVAEAQKASEANEKLTRTEDPDLVRRYNAEKQWIENNTYGFPDFTDDLRDISLGPNDVNIGELRGSRELDEIAANKIAGYAETPKDYTWHHHQDLGRMQLVRKSAHAESHWGGVSIWKKLFTNSGY